MRVYSLFDRKMREYGGIICSQNDETVRRSLQESLLNSRSLVERFQKDFDLMWIGEFDVETGILSPAEVPLLVANMESVLTLPEA